MRHTRQLDMAHCFELHLTTVGIYPISDNWWTRTLFTSRVRLVLTGSYSIEDLAEETGFDKRVIRSFIEQGLLRGPDSKGRYARYTNGHLIRLRAIKELKDHRQMTLGEIRVALLSMTEEDIHALSTKAATEPQKGGDMRSSVLDYIRTARQSQQGILREPDAPIAEPGIEVQRQSAVDRLMSVLQEETAKRSATHSKGQLWHRFSVTPDIELSVRGLQDGGQIEQWDRIADCLREILLGGTKHE